MSAADVDDYLAGVEEPKRGTLEQVRQHILAVLPDADQGISYGAPVFRVGGANVAGFAAFRAHLAYLPHSGTVTTTLAEELAGHRVTKGTVRFAVDEPLPAPLVAALVRARLAELDAR